MVELPLFPILVPVPHESKPISPTPNFEPRIQRFNLIYPTPICLWLRCEVNINDCASAPCQNKGTCIDAISGYSCVCLKGFAGMNCEHNVDECASNPCLHGICTDSVDGFECHCEPGWMGSKCDTDVEECSSNPCLNGGICQELVDAYTCLCPDGYDGVNCQADLDVCEDNALNFNRCLNEGACVDGPGTNFSCRCLPGFSGQFCEEEIDECRSGPCLNYGLCLDYVNGYSCTCAQGWTGTYCQVDINECQPNPCVYGICVQNTPRPGYTCFCIPGFVGVNCEQNYNDCFIYACPVGSECVDGLNNVTCLPAESIISAKSSVTVTTTGTFHPAPTSVPVVSWSIISQEDQESQGMPHDDTEEQPPSSWPFSFSRIWPPFIEFIMDFSPSCQQRLPH
ncbi:uncharacterized protein LOC144681100 [Cetorhinus maximus]